MKVWIDKTQQNSKCRFSGDRDETINHIISEGIKLAQEYKTRHDWIGKGSTGRWVSNLNLTIQTNGIYTTQHLS